ncbi:Ig-like domain-containing protein [Erwinia sp. S38]|uniref:Ig-like domain-containing protein n=1 Tax=Erwinia sp. S38 TaxID=2769338 RepID=UPI0019099B31|nr:Ig-like domain-containing protein [Erwinia sp. S38]
MNCWCADQTGIRRGGVILSADKTSATADSTDAVTISLKYTKDGAGVSGAAVAWESNGGTLSAATSQTGSAGGSTVKLTSDIAGSFTVTATVDGVVKTTEAIEFTAPSGG